MSDQRRGHASSRRKQQAFNSEQPINWELHPNLDDYKPKLQWVFQDTAACEIELGDLHKDILQGVPEDNRPTKLRIDRINPEILENSLGRDERIFLLEYLSKKKLEVAVNERKLDPETPGKRGINETIRATWIYVSKDKKVKIDLAIIMICSIAFRTTTDNQFRPLLGELIGLSDPDTLQRLAEYPWLLPSRCAKISKIAHAAARNLTQRRPRGSGALYGSRSLYYLVPPIIATQLEGLWHQGSSNKDIPEGLLSELIHLATHWAEGDDRGIQLGLVLAGIKRLFDKIQEKEGKKWDNIALGLKMVVSGLAAFFKGAAAARPAIDEGMQRAKEAKMDKVQRDWNRIWADFQKRVETCIGRETEEEKTAWESYCKNLKEAMNEKPPPLKESPS
ncbi:hypothetical protein GGR57DRAFT_446684 [Xylariaceae sp. FL1272]|nr:hypothetical protein GGR57DRAFT_446684 [Xylariaceae sp. FL1272]